MQRKLSTKKNSVNKTEPVSTMKKIFITTLLLLPLMAGAQTQADAVVDDMIINSILSRQFTKVVIGSKALPGNFAGFDAKDAQLTANGVTKTGNYSALSFNVSAGVTEGMASLFTNSKVNPNTSFEVNYHFINPFGRRVTITRTGDARIIRSKMRGIFEDDSIRLTQIGDFAQYDNTLLLVVNDSIINAAQRVNVTTLAINALLNGRTLSRNDSLNLNSQLSRLFSQRKTLRKFEHRRDSVSALVSQSFAARRIAIRNERNIKMAAIPETLKSTGSSFGWISLGYKLVNRNFFLFDSIKTKSFADQLTKEGFTSHQFSITYSHFSWNNNKIGSWYFGTGIAFLLDDNYAQLDKTEISDTYTYAPAPKARSEQKKYTVYRGEYEQDIRSTRPYMDIYYFPLHSQNTALHFYPEVLLSKGSKPVTNIGTGLYLTFADKNDKDGKAKVNAELYVKFNDVDNNLEKKNYKFYERNDIGIRLSFPFNFNP
jgi:hypothetical protein